MSERPPDKPPRPGVGGAPTAGLHRFAHEAMACTWEVLIDADSRQYAANAAQAAFDEIDRLEQTLSRFIPHSDIGRINALSARQSVQVGIEAIDCLELAAQVSAMTGGAFDVTFASRVDRASVGEPLLHVDRASRRVFVSADGVVVDLGALGKGYAVDQAVAVLREWGIERGLVHSGQSSVFALGGAVQGWKVALRDPRDHARTLGHVWLRDASLSGSGVAIHRGHIIDPRSGHAGQTPPGSWAVAPSAALSDALSTAFMLLPGREIEAICARHPGVGGVVFDGRRLHAYGSVVAMLG